jgi:hypothetical protein
VRVPLDTVEPDTGVPLVIWIVRCGGDVALTATITPDHAEPEPPVRVIVLPTFHDPLPPSTLRLMRQLPRFATNFVPARVNAPNAGLKSTLLASSTCEG